MKNKLFVVIIISTKLFYNEVFAQNLVPNPSFEDTVSCPSTSGEIDKAIGWSSYGNSPDYFNSCAVACSFPQSCYGIPENIGGFQFAFNGNAYAGVVTYQDSMTYREFIGIQLIQQLVIGKKYFVSAYISRGNALNCLGASNNFCFRFFMNPQSVIYPCPIDNFSDIRDSVIVTDSINWTKISGTFVADSNYQYIALGNFYDNQHTDSLDIDDNIPGHYNYAYYYIDDVCVTDDSLNCTPINGINSKIYKEELKLFPNPFSDQLSIKSETNEPEEIILYDIFSRIILRQKFVNSVTISTLQLESGIYFYEVMNKKGEIKKGKIIKE